MSYWGMVLRQWHVSSAKLSGDGAVRGGFALARRERREVRQRSMNAGERGRATASCGFVASIGLTGGASASV